MARKSQREIASLTGASLGTVNAISKKGLSEEEVIAESKKVAEKMDGVKHRFNKVDSKKEFKPSVRRIDKADDSSIRAMLQDCKERYVKNEEIIQRLDYEIANQDSLVGGTKEGNFQIAPQMNAMERFQKVNIALRNQIMQMESALGMTAEAQDEDPFA